MGSARHSRSPKAKPPRARSRKAEPPRARSRGRAGTKKSVRPVPVVALEAEPELSLEPLTPAFLLRTAHDLRVPTVALPAVVVTVDGRTSSGRLFVPAAAHAHEGPMTAEEWMNDPADFFPFLPDDSTVPVLLNRQEILVVTVPEQADAPGSVPEASVEERSVTLDCGERQLQGRLALDLPEEHRRILDCMNRAVRFVTLRERGRHHLVQRNRITRVFETRED